MKSIILFDGECNFCNKSVQFIIHRDPKGYFYFASQQSEIGQKLRKKHGVAETMDSILLIEDKQCYDQSSAVLRICSKLTGSWRLFCILLVIPKPIRDSLYKIIAKKRYKWFGKRNSCMIPSPDIRNRFLS